MSEPTESDIQVQVDDAPESVTVRVSGELSIVTAEILRQALLRTLETPRHTAIDASGLSSVDLSGLQLLCSAHRSHVGSGVVLELESPSAALKQNARTAGYDARRSICPHRRGSSCLWASID